MHRCLTSSGPVLAYAEAMQEQHFFVYVQSLKGGRNQKVLCFSCSQQGLMSRECKKEEQTSAYKNKKINVWGYVIGVRRESIGGMHVNKNFIKMGHL